MVEAGLIEQGLRLRWLNDGSQRLTWADLVALIETARPGSLLAVARAGQQAAWDDSQHLQAETLDVVNVLAWLLALHISGGKYDQPAPQPVPRPGADTPPTATSDVPPQQLDAPVPTVEETLPGVDESGRIVGEATPLDELNEWLGWV
ncbi:hypothetical protein [Corynebacterium aquilae]|uniref:Uncharacterized protein n=1 Tax=Corynebacterium aquilae DSM 44791 TaxID=1431546 RepID=A0A1L7CF77_9CORY|nr:hypothetical protein [Corynebacterium aquilae]APT84511.1 hypothetical protein CAQU_04935 [Corynebacterium aquilae DSM 44791]